jgi:hypothetical protein
LKGPENGGIIERAPSFPISSGGGFSNFYAAPTYQVPYIKSYLVASSKVPSLRPVAGYNRTGRGIPDLSAMGNYFDVFYRNDTSQIAGGGNMLTVISAFVGQLNSRRIEDGKSVVGFLNPFIYNTANVAMFTDILIGSNHHTASYSSGTTGGPQQRVCKVSMHYKGGILSLEWDHLSLLNG